MPHELFKRARSAPFTRKGLLELAEELPNSDEALNSVLADAVSERQNDAFTHLALAALGAGRKVEARHLVDGTRLLPGHLQLAALSLHCQGDVPDALVRAVARENMEVRLEVITLLIAGICSSRAASSTFAPELILQTKICARRILNNPFNQSSGERSNLLMHLNSLASMARDEDLMHILSLKEPLDKDPFLDWFQKEIVAPVEMSPLGHVPENPGPVLHSGYTMRRAVPRIGRNDPCPCGSGKKYKKCCIEKDRQRMQESSPIAGLTMDEFRENREQHLTKEMLQGMSPYELANLDPSKVEPSLHSLLAHYLILSNEQEAAVRLFETAGVTEDLEGHWEDAINFVTTTGDRDLLDRLLKLADYTQITGESLPLSTRMLIMHEPSKEVLKLMEEAALKGLKLEDEGKNCTPVIDMAYGLLEGPYPSLGVLMARSVLPVGSPLDVDVLLEWLLKARDRLGLAPVDPFEDIVDDRFNLSMDSRHDSTEMHEAMRNLEEKDRQLAKMRREMAQLHSEIKRKEKLSSKDASSQRAQISSPLAEIDPRLVTELRQRSQKLKKELKDRHDERNQLRRELEATLKDLEAMRKKNADAAAKTSLRHPENENDVLFMDEASFDLQPPRMPVFDPKFQDTIQSLPQTVVRKAIALIGRLGAGGRRRFQGRQTAQIGPEHPPPKSWRGPSITVSPGCGAIDDHYPDQPPRSRTNHQKSSLMGSWLLMPRNKSVVFNSLYREDGNHVHFTGHKLQIYNFCLQDCQGQGDET